MMFMLKSTHEKRIAHARGQEASKLDDLVRSLREVNSGLRTERQMLEAEIAMMKPDYKRGRAHREKAEAYNEARRQRRAAK